MTWYLNNRVRGLFEWLWRVTWGFFMCVFTRVRLPITRMVRHAIGSREEKPNSRTEPEVEAQTQPQTSDPQSRVEDPQGPRESASSSDRLVEEAEEGLGGFDSEDYRVETSDELYCSYDSTWETEEDQGRSHPRGRRPGASRHVSTQGMDGWRGQVACTQITSCLWV